jgi:hypothetical protein
VPVFPRGRSGQTYNILGLYLPHHLLKDGSAILALCGAAAGPSLHPALDQNAAFQIRSS